MSKTTKTALGNSLIKLLLKKPLDKVTITDITEDCGVNRMTFYYHFQNIYDLVEWVCVENAEKALADKRTHDTWQEGFLNLLNLMVDNRTFVTNVYHSVSREHLETHLYGLTETLFIDVINELSKDIVLDIKDKEFIAAFYKYAFVGIVFHWVEHNMKENPKDIINSLNILIEGTITNAVERFSGRTIT